MQHSRMGLDEELKKDLDDEELPQHTEQSVGQVFISMPPSTISVQAICVI